MNLSTSRRIAVALSIALVALATPAPAQQPHLSCDSCLVVDETGRALFARAPNRARANASSTKIITALVVRDGAELEERVTISPAAAATGGGGLDLVAGDVYRVDALLKALLMTSSNDAAVALAEHVSGTQEAFVDEMNELAGDLGARATNFVTAHGLDEPGHASSAADLARFAAELLDDPVLAEIVATTTTIVDSSAGQQLLENRNVLLERYRGATGVKTGYTLNAGDVLVASATRRGRSLIAVALGSDNETAARDAAELLDLGFASLAQTPIVSPQDEIATLVFDPSGAVVVRPASVVRSAVLPSEVEVTFVPRDGLRPPIEPGERVGTVVVEHEGRSFDEIPAVADHPGITINAPSWGEKMLAMILRTAASLTSW